MNELTIRPASRDELPAVGELTFHAFHSGGFTAEGSSYAQRLTDARARYEEAELLVAVDNANTVLGTVTIALPGSSWREIGRDDELEFRMLAVSPAARGRGVGEALTRRVLDRAEEMGCRGVVLSSSPGMRAAHRLYERLGFRRTPELDWSPAPNVPLITYRLDL